MKILTSMKHSPLYNYGGIPGLTSWLIGSPNPHGTIRLMECSRDHFEPIIPHSHRFDFECRVLEGRVRNIIWEEDDRGEDFNVSSLIYRGKPGEYYQESKGVRKYATRRDTYHPGDEYTMKAEEIHSIFFDKGTSVLFFEGPQKTEESVILQPFINNKVVPTFKVEPWMFSKG